MKAAISISIFLLLHGCGAKKCTVVSSTPQDGGYYVTTWDDGQITRGDAKFNPGESLPCK